MKAILRAALTSLVLLYALRDGARGGELPLRYPPDRPVKMERLGLDLDVDLAGKRLSGLAVLAGRAISSSVPEIALDAEGLEVRAVEDAAGHALTFTATGKKLLVRLEPPLAGRGAPFELRVDYACHPEPGSGGAWFFGPTAEDPDTPEQLWTDCEPDGARRWFPCVDTPEERQTVEVKAHVPGGFEAISNGTLVERKGDAAPGKVRFVWRERLSIPAYLVCLTVGKFAVARDDWEGIPVVTYVPPDRAAEASRSFADTKAMLGFFSRKIGVRYPWEKYSQVCVEQFVHSGMENASATTLTDRTLHDVRAGLDQSSDGLVSHELAHQWWGDLLTCRDWRDIWLNEGFATFFANCWAEEKEGSDEYAWSILEDAGGAIGGGRDIPLVRRRYGSPDEVFGGGTYPKGGWVLHMLRRKLGEERFWGGIHRYAESHRESAVETADLRRAMEEESGQSLGRFFDQWTDRTGSPAIEFASDWRDGLLEVSVRQTQPGDPFVVTAEVMIAPDVPGGAPRVVSALVEERSVRLFFPAPKRPRWVVFDPDQRILADLTLKLGEDQLMAALSEAPAIPGRVYAARALGGGDAAMRALAGALAHDPFYGVRVECARRLGALGGERARDALLAGLAAAQADDLNARVQEQAEEARQKVAGGINVGVPSHREALWRARRAAASVRAAIVEQLSGFHKDAIVGATLTALVEGGDPSYSVEAGAARALARIRAPNALSLLSKMLERPSWNEVLRTAAIEGIGELADPTALALVRPFAERGRRRDLRTTAIRIAGKLAALKAVPEPERTAVAKEIAALLSCGSPPIEGAAIDALRELGAAEALPALDALAKHDPRAWLKDQARAAAEKIRSGAPPDQEIARLRAELHDLAEENKGFRDRLERVEARGGERKGAGSTPPPAHEGPPGGGAGQGF